MIWWQKSLSLRIFYLHVWIFGMVERETNCIILYPVSDRTEATLLPIIQPHVAPDSTIYSDGWASYCNLNDVGYKHFTVLHKYDFKKVFVHTVTKEEFVVHTNRIEGAWKHAKQHGGAPWSKARSTKNSSDCSPWCTHWMNQLHTSTQLRSSTPGRLSEWETLALQKRGRSSQVS
jgi:transposase-like protein